MALALEAGDVEADGWIGLGAKLGTVLSSEAVDLHGQLDSDRENVFGQRPSRCTRLPTCAGPRWHAALVDERIRPHVRFVAAFACSAGRAPRELA
ncbi:hypothetical protein C8R45DRAFT_1098088 [Mycena sanguinolenta]|nr:hypothetical protein C8R45DRAFT_1098088 [Mycena sanguinolenta]